MPCPQFRLRSLFVLTAVVAVACVVLPWKLAQMRGHHPAEPAVTIFLVAGLVALFTLAWFAKRKGDL